MQLLQLAQRIGGAVLLLELYKSEPIPLDMHALDLAKLAEEPLQLDCSDSKEPANKQNVTRLLSHPLRLPLQPTHYSLHHRAPQNAHTCSGTLEEQENKKTTKAESLPALCCKRTQCGRSTHTHRSPTRKSLQHSICA